jgi:uncharacterized protein with HEPN domain
MQKDDMVFVGHMLDTARTLVDKVAGKSRSQFDADDNLRLALAHLIQTFGEAARRVSPPFQQAHSEIPWSKIIGMRHKVVHDYLHIDFDIVWDVATVNMPPLLAALEKIVPSETKNPGR